MINCLFVSELGMNLLSVGTLSQKGASVYLNKFEIKILLGSKIIALGINKDRLSIFKAMALKEFVLLLKTAEAWHPKPDLARIKPDLVRTKPDLARIKPDPVRTKQDLAKINKKWSSAATYSKAVKTKSLNPETKPKKAKIVEIED